jgi:hypothetical protein
MREMLREITTLLNFQNLYNLLFSKNFNFQRNGNAIGIIFVFLITY